MAMKQIEIEAPQAHSELVTLLKEVDRQEERGEAMPSPRRERPRAPWAQEAPQAQTLPVIRDHLLQTYSARVGIAQAKLSATQAAAIQEFAAECAEASMALEVAMMQRDREYVEGAALRGAPQAQSEEGRGT